MYVNSIEESTVPEHWKFISTPMLLIKHFTTNYIPIYPKLCLLSRQYVRRGYLYLIDFVNSYSKENGKGLIMCEAALPSSPLVLPDPNERGGGHTQHTHTLRVQSRSEVTDDRTGTPSGTHTATQRRLAI